MRQFIEAVRFLCETGNNLPLTLYHGTTDLRLEYFKGHGLERQRRGVGVYLTDKIDIAQDYAEYAALIDTDTFKEDTIRPVVLSINTAHLNPALLRPDDYEFEAEKQNGNHLLKNYERWEDVPWQISLSAYNQVAYAGFIPWSAITVQSISEPYK